MEMAGIATSATDEEREFLRRRVAFAALVSGALVGIFWLYRTITGLAFTPSELTDPSYWLHGAATAAFFLVWALARYVPLGIHGLRRTEVIGYFLGCILLCAMAFYIPLVARPDLIVVLALTYALSARSTFIPSSGRRTLLLSLAIGAVMLPLTYVHILEIDTTKWRAIDPVAFEAGPEAIAQVATLTQAVWWLMSTIMVPATSWVIYGLRRRVRDAMQLGQYRLEVKLGEGGMGEVYRAHHAFLRRPTAVKLLRPERAGELAVKRFETEVQLTAKLVHPNTVTIFDYGRTANGVFYYAMELIDGADLDRIVVASGPQSQARVRHLLIQICSALVEAHGIGLIHRDIKPGNIMVTLPHRLGGASDHVKLVDFGLVKQIEAPSDVQLTKTNVISGTPQYMSPETILSSEHVDARSDLYGVGAVAYFLLTGRPVFEGDSVVKICSDHLHTTPDPISKHRDAPLSAELERILMSCLAKKPEDRPASAFALQEALDACTDVGVWTPLDAQAWWQANDVQVKTPSARSSEAIAMTVDFGSSRR